MLSLELASDISLQKKNGMHNLGINRFYLQQKNCTPHEDWRNLLKSENSSTFTMMLTSPRIPCIVSNTGIQPDITDPIKRNYYK
jgi:hypothetical protein